MINLKNIDNVIIRKASIQDVPEVCKIQVDGWRKTYKGIISDDYLDSLKNNIKNKIQETIKWFNEDKISKRFVVALEDEIKACFSLIFPSKTPNNIEAEVQLSDMYVKNEYTGLGIGTKIFEFIKDFLLSEWCFKDNIDVFNF